MANLQLFNTLFAKLPPADLLNGAAAPAYAMSPRHKLAQLAMTGCLSQTFYAEVFRLIPSRFVVRQQSW